MSIRVTIQDIARTLGLSRNTVSKALNGDAGVQPDTRRRVLAEAVRVNYKSMGVAHAQPVPEKNLLLLCRDNQLTSSFFSRLIRALHEHVRERGAAMTTQFLSPAEIAEGALPPHAALADGVFALEILHRPYIRQLLASGKPTVFFDCCTEPQTLAGSFDIVLESEQPGYALLNQLFSQGVDPIGFVGDPAHCLGFANRYACYRLALADGGLPIDTASCILYREADGIDHAALFAQRLRHMRLPRAFFCANNVIQARLLEALQACNIAAGKDVAVHAFGSTSGAGSAQTEAFSVRERIASAMALLLLDRIDAPQTPLRILHTQTP